MDSLAPIVLTLGQTEAGERIDKVLAAQPLGFSRATLQRWIGEGRVLVDGLRISGKEKTRAGQVVEIRPLPPPPSDALPLDILFEDTHLIVLHKPAGQVVHPAPGHEGGTLVNAILHHTEVELGADPRRPGIVHRLDKNTSGVMVVARTDPAREGLMALFSSHDIERVYEAICLGAVPERASYETLYGRHPVERKRFSSKVRTGKRAVTHVARVRALAGASLVRCQLETGRTHQIRVHLADHGFPLLGDPVYGRTPREPLLKEVASELGRQALHARVLGFVHPVTREALRFEVDPPADFQRALTRLTP